MSSDEHNLNGREPARNFQRGPKKQRTGQPRACDYCRRKKTRCAGALDSGQRCSNCIDQDLHCTYVEESKKRGPSKKYVEALEDKVERMDKLLRQFLPDESLYNEMMSTAKNSDINLQPHLKSVMTNTASPTTEEAISSAKLESVTTAIRGATNPATSERDQDDDDITGLLINHFKKLKVNPTQYRFFGKSSIVMLISKAMQMKCAYNGTSIPILPSVSADLKRIAFWNPRPWELQGESPILNTPYSFPEPDLAAELVDLYFTFVNLYLPLLHEPTFKRSVQEGLHLENNSFGSVFLLVCALGARHSDNPKVLLEDQNDQDVQHSCGWKWFKQVEIVKESILSSPSLYTLQSCCLSVQYHNTSRDHSCWIIIGIGIRLAQEVGAHRRKVHGGPHTVEDELWKRAFWTLVWLDRLFGSRTGRPCAVHDEDFDLDFPLECDDAYWENAAPENNFKQPPGKPSLVTYFVHYLKLLKIFGFCLRTIYAVDKGQTLVGLVGPQWEQHIVAELDSALNHWFDSIPEHLRWDLKLKDDNFFNQSASLYCAYYHTQVLIHRPFIPSPNKLIRTSFPSLAICTNASRASAHIIDIQRYRTGLPAPQLQRFAFTSAVVLLLNMWDGKCSGVLADPSKDLADVHKCMEALRVMERRWSASGKLRDMLNELASKGGFDPPDAFPPLRNKRERDSEGSTAAPCSDLPPSPENTDGYRPIAGSKRLNRDALNFSDTRQPLDNVPTPSVAVCPNSQTELQDSSSAPRGHNPVDRLLSSDPQNEILMYSDEFDSLPLQESTFSNNDWGDWGDSLYINGTNVHHTSGILFSQFSTETQQPPPLSLPLSDVNTIANGMVQHGSIMDHLYAAPLAGRSYSDEASPFVNGTSQVDLSGTSLISGHQYTMPPHIAGNGDLENLQHLESWGLVANGHGGIDCRDTVGMWSNAPLGFRIEDWNTYISNLAEVTNDAEHGQQRA